MGAKYSKSVTMDEGVFFVGVSSNTAPGTGLNYTSVGAFTTTTAAFTWANNASTGGKSIVIDKIKLICTTGQTTTSMLHGAMVLDYTSQAPSAGQLTIIPSATLSQWPSTQSSVATFCGFSGNQITKPTWGTTHRVVGRSVVPNFVLTANDTYVFNFGADTDTMSDSPLTAARPVAAPLMPAKFVSHMPPCIIGPGHWGVFHLWQSAAGTTPTFEYEVSWWEV